jgi:hypothetical protein
MKIYLFSLVIDLAGLRGALAELSLEVFEELIVFPNHRPRPAFLEERSPIPLSFYRSV